MHNSGAFNADEHASSEHEAMASAERLMRLKKGVVHHTILDLHAIANQIAERLPSEPLFRYEVVDVSSNGEAKPRSRTRKSVRLKTRSTRIPETPVAMA